MGLFRRRGSAGSDGHTAVAEAETTPMPADATGSVAVATAFGLVDDFADMQRQADEDHPGGGDAAEQTHIEEASTPHADGAPTDQPIAESTDEQPAAEAIEEQPAAEAIDAQSAAEAVEEQPAAEAIEEPPARLDAADQPSAPDAAATATEVETAPSPAAPVAEAEGPAFGFDAFPSLPLGAALWSDAIANVFNLRAVVPRLPNSILVLTGPVARAAAVVTDGTIVDAVWVSADQGFLGDDATEALLKTETGTLTAYVSDDPRLAAVLPMLWRWPRTGASFPAAWVHTDDLVAEMRTSRRTCALLVECADPGVALFNEGSLVAAFTAAHPWPGKSIAALWNLLHAAGGRVTVIGVSDPALVPDPADGRPTAAVRKRTGRGTTSRRASTAKAAVGPSPAASAEAVAEGAVAGGPGAPDGDAGTPSPVAPEEPGTAPGTPTPVWLAVEAPPDPTGSVADAEPSRESVEADRAIVTIAGDRPDSDHGAAEPTDMERVVAREASEFVAPRLDIDVDGLRSELSAIAATWLGADDAAPVLQAIGSARAGVDDFVSAIAAIGTMEIPGHEHAVVRAMAREMHYRASEVLCGV